MGMKIFFSLSLLIVVALGAPVYEFDDGDSEDTAIVESTVREVRAIKPRDLEFAPTHYHRTYGDGDRDDVGYSRKNAGQGKRGYQKFDSFHKKNGDNYGYEKHDSFGIDEKKGQGGEGSHAAYKRKEGNKKKQNDGASAKYQEAADSGEEGEAEEGDEDEASSENDGDAEGEYDVEAAAESDGGYDEADAVNYRNPKGYSYGGGGDYDFK